MSDIFFRTFVATLSVIAPLLFFIIIFLVIVFFIRFFFRSSKPQSFPRINGVAGSGIGQAKKFSEENIAKGVAGEELTGHMLQSLLHEDNNVYIFHNLRFPGSKVADVDHIVVAGHRIAVIDSKMWTSGYFLYDNSGLIMQRKENSSQPRKSSFHVAVERYREIFPQYSVSGWYFIHSHDGGVSTCSPDATSLPRLSTAEQGLEEVRWWLSGDQSTNYSLLKKLSSYRK